MESFVFLLAFLVCSYFVISPKINDGLMLKLGFILMSIGFLGVAMATIDECDIENPVITVFVGLFVSMLAIVIKIRSSKFRRITDWLHLDKQHKATERRVN